MLPSTGRARGQIRSASASVVESYFATLPANQRRSRWLAIGNRYRLDCIHQYKADLDSHTVNDTDLVRYVSASCPTHVIDGWAFLGRAVDAALRGDSYGAIHMAYYAELRAAMSVLAGQGIGVFSREHPILDKTGRSKKYAAPKSGTHAMIWPMLHYWSTLKRGTSLLNRLITPKGNSLSQWLEYTGSKISIKAIAEDWLSTWGLDLVGLDGDHERRNEVSYRPSEFKHPPVLDTLKSTQFVEELWTLFEPGSNGSFPSLEQELVRRARRRRIDKEPIAIDSTRLGLSTQEATYWKSFLDRDNSPIPIQLAEKNEPISSATAHLGVISRAALLLFVATTAARRMLAGAGYSREDMRFWWGSYGISRGLWRSPDDISSPTDCWADIERAITDSAKWRSTQTGAPPPLREWRQSQSLSLADFTGFELVGIWGLVP